MARVLLVEDDENQLTIRKLLFELQGHEVTVARTAEEALAQIDPQPTLALIDLSIPAPEDGLELVRRLRERAPLARIAVLTGRVEALRGRPEESMVDEVIEKSRPTRSLLATVARLVACLVLSLGASVAKDFPFESAGTETIAEVDLSSPLSDWSKHGREAAVARVLIDGRFNQHVIVFAEKRDPYRIFLGTVERGKHTLTVVRDDEHSAAASTLEVGKARFRSETDGIWANTPAIFARQDSIGKFTDVPLLVYAERLPAGVQYTVIFSNEDGGHSTRGLLARWGRTTDIEYVYRLEKSGGFIQTRDHKEVPYSGELEEKHPLLIPVTLNNMVEPGRSELRFQIAPIEVDLKDHSREIVMDRNPWTYAVASKELVREGKLPEVGDPRNYLYVEAYVTNSDSRVAFKAKTTIDRDWRRSDRGDKKLAIERSGWVRAAIEMPQGTGPKQVSAFTFECLAEGEHPLCSAEKITAFFLTPDYQPGRPLRLPSK